MPLLISEIYDMPDAEVALYRNVFNAAASDTFFQKLQDHNQIKWEQQMLKLWGRSIALPRLTAWYGDEGKSYTYSGLTLQPLPWTPTLLRIKHRLEEVVDVRFNSVLLNLYRDGRDSVSWHSDDEPVLGINPVIGSVSFGSTRRFQLKHKTMSTQRISVELTHGSMLLMQGATQHHWLHRIPKTTPSCGLRINLTFRVIR
jgi:alkylated DNA repair dioxygenase AlkB